MAKLKTLNEIYKSYSLLDLEKAYDKINEFLSSKYSFKLPLYSSLDIRHSKNKISCVDVNLFSAGFCHLSNQDQELCVENFRKYFKNKNNDAEFIALIPEAHTRNFGYLDNLLALQEIIKKSFNKEVKILWPLEELPKPWDLKFKDKIVTFHPWSEIDKTNFIISNNDFSSNKVVTKLVGKDCIPSTILGWHNRTKSKHFKLAKEIFDSLELDLQISFLKNLYANFETIDNYSKNDDFFNILKNKIVKLMEKSEEFEGVFVKDSQGTYGRGVFSIKNLEDLESLKSKVIKDFAKNKTEHGVQSVFIQESVPTEFFYKNLPVEHVSYWVNGSMLEGFYRSGSSKSSNITNLNEPGSHYIDCDSVYSDMSDDYVRKTKTIYKIVGLVHMYACGRELNMYEQSFSELK